MVYSFRGFSISLSFGSSFSFIIVSKTIFIEEDNNNNAPKKASPMSFETLDELWVQEHARQVNLIHSFH